MTALIVVYWYSVSFKLEFLNSGLKTFTIKDSKFITPVKRVRVAKQLEIRVLQNLAKLGGGP